MEKRLVIIDGNSLINRAYYAMQRPMITKEGLYTQGVYGFLNMLTKIKKDYEPEYLAVAFDRKTPTFRHLEYSEYKAGRKKMPVELAMQLPVLKEVLDAMNIKMLEIDGFEADDIIGTVVTKAEAEGLNPLIITGDKDELQLATDITRVLITKKGISEFEIYDREAMVEKYGFTPTQFIDYKGLMGDQSDNIPGIPGVGEKTAQKLLLEYGSVENLINSVDSIKNEKLRQKIEDNAQLAMMSKRLATIITEVPIDIEFSEFKVEEPQFDRLINIYIKLEFNSFLKKMPSRNASVGTSATSTALSDASKPETEIGSLENASTAVVSADEFENNYSYEGEHAVLDEIPPMDSMEIIKITDMQGLEMLRESLKEGKPTFIKTFSDNSHVAKPTTCGISIMSNNRLFFVGSDADIQKKTAHLLLDERPKLAGHSLKRDFFVLLNLLEENASVDVSQSTNNESTNCMFNTYFDTAVAQYVLDPSKSNYELKTLLLEYFHEEIEEEKKFMEANAQFDLFTDSSDKYAQYALQYCYGTAELMKVQIEKLKAEQLEKVFYEVELPLIEVMASMEFYGFSVDKQELTASADDISKRLDELSSQIYELAGEEFNINSPAQLGVILFEKLELPVGKKTKTGYSTNAEVLEKLRTVHPIADLILEYRTIAKLKSTYIDGLVPLINNDGKIHAHFQQTVTATGRISCTEPNLQNIPVRQELGRKLRKAFVTESDRYCLTGADYSQIELRVLADMSGDEALIDAFEKGTDIHAATAARVFGVPEDEVTALQRSNAKAVNFGVIYGMSGFGLATEIHVTRKEAEKYINDYFEKYTAVRKFMDAQVAHCKEKGYVTTIMNRKRTIHEINASNYMVRQLGERLAMNSPIQGSAADIIKIAMIKVYHSLHRGNFKSRLILQVHDELIIETAIEEKAQVEELLVKNMTEAVEMKVRLEVSLNSGANWYDLK